ncbi:MAG: hypothetical protein ACTHNQ_15320 [Microbacterium sp.]|uniref:hypothetical protein n=1 Tax=Microbacterium sp. TaxID=51671 RepID=UPI003F7EA7F0
MHMRAPLELGGSDLALAEQMSVIARLAEFDSASAWCTMVANNGIGAISEYLDDEGIAEVYAAQPKPIGAAVAAVGGPATPVAGGYKVSGLWRFCSNVHGADWVRCTALVEGDPGHPVMIVVPHEDLQIKPTWRVTGLRGTGSADFILEDTFVPARRTADMRARTQLRGDRDYTRDVGGALAVYEHAAFAIGLARRARTALAESLRNSPDRAQREVVKDEFARVCLEMDAAELLAFSAFGAVDDPEATWSSDPLQGLPAVATYVTELSQRCIALAGRRAGSRALFVPNEFDRLSRDITAALAHALVNDANYARFGEHLIAFGAAPQLASA